MRARLLASRDRGDDEGEARAAEELSRRLVARRAEPALAIELAERSLSLKEDEALRADLVSWLCGIGEHPRAAEALRHLVPFDSPKRAANVLAEVGLLLARGGNPRGALDAFEEAARLDPDDPAPLELSAMLASSAPEVVSREMGARFFLQAASSYERAGKEDEALEALFRAFELAPESLEAAQELSRALRSRDREKAALEVERAHIAALPLVSKDGARSRRDALLDRMKRALTAGELASALEAALDAQLDTVLDGPLAERFDDLLARTGLYELFAARLEARAEAAEGSKKARLYADLARLYTGPLASPERAIETWLAALTADSRNEEALRALRAHAAAIRDDSALVEGLLRAGTNEGSEPGARSACLRELAGLAEGRFDAPSLAIFALSRLDPAMAQAAEARLAARLRAEEKAIAATRGELATSEGDARIAKLRKLASLLRGRPSEAEALGQALGELVQRVPGDSSLVVALERLATRTENSEFLSPLLRGGEDSTRARLGFMRAARRRGDSKTAFAEVSPLLQERKNGLGPFHALVLAGQLGEAGARAEALEALADFVPPELRSILLGASAEAWLAANESAAARRAIEAALEENPGSSRAILLLASIDAKARDERGAWTIPQALELGPPRAELYRALVEISERASEAPLALLFARRWLALRPADVDALEATHRLALEAALPERFEESLSTMLARPLPVEVLARLAAGAIEARHRQDPEAASALALRMLDALGPAKALCELVVRLEDEALRAASLERRLSAGLGDPGALLLELSEARSALDDEAGSIAALHRAIANGFEIEANLARLPEEPPKASPDAAFTYLEALASGLASLGASHAPSAISALRCLAAARWDLAEDREGAVRDLVGAARLGGEKLAEDLVSLGGADFALEVIESLAKNADDAGEVALALATAARIANDRGESERALAFLEDALALEARIDEPTLTLFVKVSETAGASARAAGLLEAMVPKLSGAEGARMAAFIAKAAIEGLDDPKLANLSLLRALDGDRDAEEFAALIPHTARLAGEAETALAWIERVIERAPTEQGKPSSKALRLASAVAERLEDPSTYARLLVKASRPSLAPPLAPDPSSLSPSLAPTPALSPAPAHPPAPFLPSPSLAPNPAPSLAAPSPIAPAPRITHSAASPATFSIPPLFPDLLTAPEKASAPPPSPPPPSAETDAALLEALRQGSLEAGDHLAERCLAASPPRVRDLVYVRQLQAHYVPGNRERLRQLRDAAVQARDISHARAVEHVLRAFDASASRLAPPALAAQVEQPEAVMKLIFRSPAYLGLEALAVVCDGAPQLFRRDLAAYGYSGAERIPLGSRAPVGRVYTMAARLLGLTRVPLFHARTPRKTAWMVALLAPPALLLSGDAQEDTAELRYEIGAGLASAMPAHALIAALPRERAQTVLMAVLAAYGPPTQVPRHPAVTAIAETLWQLLPPRAERYMRDLCAHVGAAALEYEAVLEQQKVLVRRAGMFVSGDLELTIQRYFADERRSPTVALTSAEGLAAACAAHPQLANLVRLATSADYAKARWQAGGAAPQVPASSRGFRPGS